MSIAVVAALASAFCYASASVAQQQATLREAPSGSRHARLLVNLVRKPLWLVGALGSALAYLLHAVALGNGSLTLVQPLLVTGLLFALPMEAIVMKRRVALVEITGVVLVTGGLALFLLAASPGKGAVDPPTDTWLWLTGGTLTAVVALSLIAGKNAGGRRAACLGAAAGVAFGLTSALTKTCAGQISGGLGPLFSQWQLYALVVSGGLGVLYAQSAFQAGPLGIGLTMLSVLEPLVGIGFGLVAFDEPVQSNGLAITLQILGVMSIIAGTTCLGHALPEFLEDRITANSQHRAEPIPE